MFNYLFMGQSDDRPIWRVNKGFLMLRTTSFFYCHHCTVEFQFQCQFECQWVAMIDDKVIAVLWMSTHSHSQFTFSTLWISWPLPFFWACCCCLLSIVISTSAAISSNASTMVQYICTSLHLYIYNMHWIYSSFFFFFLFFSRVESSRVESKLTFEY